MRKTRKKQIGNCRKNECSVKMKSNRKENEEKMKLNRMQKIN